MTKAWCPICGETIRSRGPGRPRMVCQSHRRLHEALLQVEKVLTEERPQDELDERHRMELRRRLLLLSTEVPRARDRQGRFKRGVW